MRKIFFLAALAAVMALPTTTDAGEVPFIKKTFGKYWRVEAEKGYEASFYGDTLELKSPAGLTLWLNRQLEAPVVIEYDATVMSDSEGDRLSDLNAFWMASDPSSPKDFWKNSKGRGNFDQCYGMQLYYLGYGGNYNKTTRFRRYTGDRRGITDSAFKPGIITEYTDAPHLLEPGKWYHIKITADANGTQYYINGERLVDYRDPAPLTKGYFGFRTTVSRTRITNFSYTETQLAGADVPLHWVGGAPAGQQAVTFGVPFIQGELKKGKKLTLLSDSDPSIPTDQWVLATWPDGSVKWLGVAATIPAGSENLRLSHTGRNNSAVKGVVITESPSQITVKAGGAEYYISRAGSTLVDSIVAGGITEARDGRLVAIVADNPGEETAKSVSYTDFTSDISGAEIERSGDNSACIKLSGSFRSTTGRNLFPFTARLYFTAGSPETKIVYSFVYDADMNKDFVRGMGLRFGVPMRDEMYNRHIAFSGADGGVWSEPVQPVVGRRVLTLQGDTSKVLLQERQMRGERLPAPSAFDEKNQAHLRNWATWDAYRLSQIGPDGFTVRKKATAVNPWIGTAGGKRAGGLMFVGDTSGGVELGMEDFWQTCPSTLEVTGATTPEATATLWIWSPEAEAMDMRHYDVRAHDLLSSYEDVQEGMSTPYGIAHTSGFRIAPVDGYKGKETFARHAADFSSVVQLLPTPEYLHSRRAFGVWSLPDRSNAARAEVERRLDEYIDIYRKAIDEHRWYGFWNYGDVMHAYDPMRHEWMYDVGGYAWDNTELASPLWLWYSFLRRGDADTWRMARAMTRHNGEVDVYHIGPHAGLGSRHNVSHWGCGAKESRISQALWDRFPYYLTADERSGDLMTEVVDSDTLLYHLDPMRLAEPRSKYPCTAPARLRIGPDWLAYAANWMTQWERTGDTRYRDKIITGMKSIVALPSGFFTGPLALGYDPATGVITTECDSTLQTTNHLMTIMGGFEFVNELMPVVSVDGWEEAWLDHADRYKDMARTISRNKFRVSRLDGYAAYKKGDKKRAEDVWYTLFHQREHLPGPPKLDTEIIKAPQVLTPRSETLPLSTNDAALWSLDAIYLQEIIPQGK